MEQKINEERIWQDALEQKRDEDLKRIFMSDKLGVLKNDDKKLLEILEKARLWDEMQNAKKTSSSKIVTIDDDPLEY